MNVASILSGWTVVALSRPKIADANRTRPRAPTREGAFFDNLVRCTRILLLKRVM